MEKVKVVILAVTKTFSEYCIAGMTETGEWVRPLPPIGTFWGDLSYNDDTFIQVGDVWEIENYVHELDPTSPGHTENIRIPSYEDITRIDILSNKELMEFVERHQESVDDLRDTLEANNRSLCLVSVESFEQVPDELRVVFDFEGEHYRNTTWKEGYPLTDIKWRSILQKEMKTPDIYDSLFLCIGLARTEPKKNILKEHPMVISILTDPAIPVHASYPH